MTADAEWEIVPVESFGQEWDQIAKHQGLTVSTEDVLSLLLAQPEYADALRLNNKMGSEEADRGLVPGTRTHISVERLKDLRWDAPVGAAAYVLLDSPPLAIALGLLPAVLRSLSRLTRAELEVLFLVKAIRAGSTPSAKIVTFDQIVAAYGDVPTELEDILESLEQKGALRRSRRGWRLLL